ncbi:hypothetical protein DFH11DRAFT_1515635 [Phellopilus nigrolimitatus]|nr:hypothetical protein DFH11DRAFT_1515635 [Phellopilus nigrolimitatus]
MHSARSDIEPLDPSLVPLLVSEIDISLYGQAAMLTLLIYDTIITMDKEIKYFWSTPCTFVSLIYFANRYIGILGAVCGILGGSWKDWTIIITIDYILLMRVSALYHQNKKFAACLRTIFVLEAALGLAALIYTIIYAKSKQNIYCRVYSLLNNCSSFCMETCRRAVLMVYAIILMVLALYKAAQYWRESAGFSQFNLLTVLIQDQAIYFILVIFCSIMGIVSYQVYTQSPLLANVLSVLVYPRLLCVLGSHLLIHLKEAGERRANGGTSYRMEATSSIDFS